MTSAKQILSPPLSGVRVADAMHPGVVTCPADDGLPAVAATMVSHGIHAVVVGWSAEAGALIVTDRELVQAALERPEARAAEIAREPVASLPADQALDHAVDLMAKRYVAHVLATDPGSGAPAGVVSSFDVAAVLAGEDPSYTRMLRLSPARPSASATTLARARVSDVMHPGIETCPAEAPLSAVARVMAQHRVHCVAVAGIEHPREQLTWGLVGDMDLVLAVHRGAVEEPAASIAATEPLAVVAEESLEHVARLMAEHETSHVVVVDSSGLPCGMVSTRDVAAILAASA